MGEKDRVIKYLNNLDISYQVFTHPPLPTIDIAIEYWKNIPGVHCKNLFFRNHKGDRHYLVIMECHQDLNIHDLEKRLKQGKLSFASHERLFKYLGLKPGSVSPFGLINDSSNHVKLFIDKNLEDTNLISFHPNDNRATLVLKTSDFLSFLDHCTNEYHFQELY